MGSRSRLAGFVGAAALALLAAAAHAQNAPPAGTVVDGSLKGKTLTFVSYGGIYQ
ncbi:ABC transporter, partial [Mesorhizobium sp. M7A.F.Ca.CA.002.06.1.1]